MSDKTRNSGARNSHSNNPANEDNFSGTSWRLATICTWLAWDGFVAFDLAGRALLTAPWSSLSATHIVSILDLGAALVGSRCKVWTLIRSKKYRGDEIAEFIRWCNSGGLHNWNRKLWPWNFALDPCSYRLSGHFTHLASDAIFDTWLYFYQYWISQLIHIILYSSWLSKTSR
jgi:hypothetical protein